MNPPAALHVLVVCTANQCRSPLVAALLRERLRQRGADAAAVEVASAGFLEGGRPMPSTGVRVARGAGLELSDHRSTRLTREMTARADLILTATREHARELVADDDALWCRTFVLQSAERQLREMERRSGQSRSSWIEAAGAARDRRTLLGGPGPEDLEDPRGRSGRVWRRVLATSASAVDGVAGLLVDGDVGA